MTITEVTSKRSETVDDRDETVPLPPPDSRAITSRRIETGPFLITLATVALAGLLGWAMWDVYMGAPWTRDATVRAYVVAMAPEVSGRIVELHVVDNKYVRKGDLLPAGDRSNQLQDCGQPIRNGGTAGAGERAKHRSANGCPAGADQCRTGTIAAGECCARICTA